MIRIRIDDVMCESSEGKYKSPEKATNKFKSIHEWTQRSEALSHVPAIIVSEMERYPEATEFIKEKTALGEMSPQVHGWEHINYEELSEEEISKHINMCLEWFSDVLNYQPTIWITPWGSTGSPEMKSVAKKLYLTIEDTRFCLDPSKAVAACKKFNTPNFLHGQTIMEHWWRRGLHLLRVAEIVRHGSYTKAVEWDKINRLENEEVNWCLFDQ
jgi:peptidoglycan/xylan/chitin deacetylase (PgdA/CDA1 family)